MSPLRQAPDRAQKLAELHEALAIVEDRIVAAATAPLRDDLMVVRANLKNQIGAL